MQEIDHRVGQKSAKRVQVVERVRARFPRFGEFVTQYSTNMSMTGMFLRSDDPQPPGTRFDFEFVVSDEAPMIFGTGVVVWVRENDEAVDRPAGMGVRFVNLDPKSRRVIRWLMDTATAQGQETFQLGKDRTDPVEETDGATGEIATPVDRNHIRSASSMRNLKVRAKSRRRADLVALGVLAIIVLVWWVSRANSRLVADRPDQSGNVTEPIPTTGQAAPGESNGTSPGPRGIESLEADAIVGDVRGWAKAWTERDAERYLAYYSEAFVPPRGMSREQWSSWRRERLAAPRFIRVALSGFEVESLEENTATVSFFQSYRSDLMNDTIRKQLRLVREDGVWKILREELMLDLS